MNKPAMNKQPRASEDNAAEQPAEQNPDRNTILHPEQNTDQHPDRNTDQHPDRNTVQHPDRNAVQHPEQNTDQNAEQSAAQKAESGAQQPTQGRRIQMPRDRSTVFLLALLGAQCLLAGVLFWQSQRGAEIEVPDALVSIDTNSVDRIELQDKDQAITLNKNENNWQLADDSKLPADTAKISSLIDAISNIKPGLPVATTAASRAQLDVADDDFQRHLQLISGDNTVADLYIGSSPGFRKAHTRVADDDAIYAVQLNVFDMPVTADGWFDKKLLAFKDISGITGPDYTLLKSADKWSLEGSSDGSDSRELDQSVVDTLLAALQNFQVSALTEPPEESAEDEAVSPESKDDSANPAVADGTGSEASASPDGEEPEPVHKTVEMKITHGGGDSQLTLQQQDTSYSATVDKWQNWFEIPAQEFDNITNTTLENLLVTKPPASEDSNTGESGEPEPATSAPGNGDQGG